MCFFTLEVEVLYGYTWVLSMLEIFNEALDHKAHGVQ